MRGGEGTRRKSEKVSGESQQNTSCAAISEYRINFHMKQFKYSFFDEKPHGDLQLLILRSTKRCKKRQTCQPFNEWSSQFTMQCGSSTKLKSMFLFLGTSFNTRRQSLIDFFSCFLLCTPPKLLRVLLPALNRLIGSNPSINCQSIHMKGNNEAFYLAYILTSEAESLIDVMFY